MARDEQHEARLIEQHGDVFIEWECRKCGHVLNAWVGPTGSILGYAKEGKA